MFAMVERRKKQEKCPLKRKVKIKGFFFLLKTTSLPEKKKKRFCNERSITMKRISATSSLLQLYNIKLARAGEMALMVTDRIANTETRLPCFDENLHIV